MHELMINCFDLTGTKKHEVSIFKRPPENVDLFCSKHPSDAQSAASLISIDPNLWVINMIRDPRDIIVSRHRDTS